MARLPSQVVIQESPITASLDALTAMILGIAEQEYAAKEDEKNRQWEESMLYRQANIDALEKSKDRHWEIRDRAVALGTLELSAEKLKDLDTTQPFKAYVKEESDQITTALNSIDELNRELESNMSAFKEGTIIAKNIDADFSGHVDADELAKFIKEGNEQRVKQGLDIEPLSEAFQFGIKSWTMDPDKRLAMALQGFEVAEAEEYAKYLPKRVLLEYEMQEITKEQMEEELAKAKLMVAHQELVNEYAPEQFKDEEAFRKLSYDELGAQIDLLKMQREKFELEKPYLESKFEDEATMRKQSIDKMGLDNDTLRHNLAIAEQYDDKRMAASINLVEMQVKAGNEAIEHADYEWNDKMRKDAIATQEKSIQNHMENQDALGVKLLTSISFELEEGVHTPLSSIITLLQTNPDSEKLADKITDLKSNKRYSHIAPDVVALYESITISKTEPSVPDYSIFLQKIQDIDDNHKAYQALLKSTKKGVVIKDVIDKYIGWGIKTSRRAVMTNTLKAAKKLYNDGTLTKKEYVTLVKGVQWEDTGIMENTELIELSTKSSDIMKSLRITLNNHLALDANYSQEEVAPLFEE